MIDQKSGLDAILQQTTQTRARPGHVLVTIDPATDKVVHDTGLMGRLARGFRPTVTYSLTVDKPAEIYDVDQCMKVFVTKEEAQIRFRLAVVARASRAEQIVEALTDKVRSPIEVLMMVVTDAIRIMSDESQRQGPDSLARRISRDRDNWQRRIAQSIFDRIGLEAELIFELGTLIPDLPEISLEFVEVRPKDAPHRTVPLSVHFVLEATEERANDPLPRSDRERRERIRVVVATAFRDEVTLYDYWFDRAKVEQILSRAVDRAFASAAHRTRHVQMEPASPPHLREEKVACTIGWKGNSGRLIEFYVEAVLAFLPTGAGLYDSLHLAPRKEWLAAKASQALEIAMQGRDFWDLALVDQAEVAAKVRAILGVAARETGQAVEPIVAKVILPENRWLDRQYLEITGKSFKTKNELGVAEFDINLEIQFNTIRPLIEYVRHHSDTPQNSIDFNAEIGKHILAMVTKNAAATISQIEHVDYFAKWEQWDHFDDVVPGALPGEANYVHNRLVMAISRELRDRFSPSVCVVRLRRVDSAVGKLVKVIETLGPIEVSLQIEPAEATSKAQFIPLTARFRPGFLDPAYTPDAVRRGAEHIDAAAIADTLQSKVSEFLDGRTTDDLRSLARGTSDTPPDGGRGDARPLFVELETYVSSKIVAFYGFSVRLETVQVSQSRERSARLDASSSATDALQAVTDQRKEQIQSELAQLRDQRRRNLAIVDKLHRAQLDNPLLTADDRNRYDLDEEKLERAKARIADDDRVIARLLTMSVAAVSGAVPGLAAGVTESQSAEPPPARPAESPRATAPLDGEVLPPERKRPDRL